jgi:hypothetical protein
MTTEDKKKIFLQARPEQYILFQQDGTVYAKIKSELSLVDDMVYYSRWNSPWFHIEELQSVSEHQILDSSPKLGSDPELFVTDGTDVVPSFVLLDNKDQGSVTMDGFQVELHPIPSTCRVSGGYWIGDSLSHLRDIAKRKGLQISFNTAHRISDKTWDSTDDSVKRFGCNPTNSAYSENVDRGNGLRERFRAGGGHIHIDDASARGNRDELVQLLDIVVGNTLVLIDRDSNNAERRLKYGRAGEYRPKEYGLEYRVPSNFWLRDYVLWSLVAGLIRNALTIRLIGLDKEFVGMFDMNKIRDAINNNDYTLALENFEKLSKIYKDKDIYFSVGVSKFNIDKFTQWATSESPLSHINDGSQDAILNSWPMGGDRAGFEKFINKF